MKINKIIITPRFIAHTPQNFKMQKARKFYEQYGILKEKILIDKQTKTLIDGYTSYLLAKELGLKRVHVVKLKNNKAYSTIKGLLMQINKNLKEE
jgi:hypothetical protein